MKQILSELMQVTGVLGFALFDETGVCLEQAASSPQQLTIFRAALARLQTALEACRHIEQGPAGEASLVVRFVRGALILSPFGANTLLLLIEPGTNEAMVSIGVQVAAAKLRALPAPERHGSSPSTTGGNTGPASARRPVRSSPPAPASHEIAGAAAVRELGRLLTTWVGPFAKVHVQQELRAMGTDMLSIARSDFEDLAIRLATKIPEAHERRAFLDQAAALARRRPT